MNKHGDINASPIWRNGAFAGEFGDAFIANTELEGGHPAPAVKVLTQLGREALAHYISDNFGQDEKIQVLDSAARAHILRALDDLDGAATTAFALNSAKEGPTRVTFIRNFVESLEKLKPGERTVIIGGWASKASGHAICHVVEKLEAPEKFAFVVCNTGDGVQYHPGHNRDYPKEKHMCAIRLDNIDATRMLDQSFWYLFWKMQMTRKDENDAPMMYEVLLPHLIDGPLHTHIDHATSGDYETIQRAGTCYYRSILTTLRYLLKSSGCTASQRKRFLHLVRESYLRRIEEDLEKTDFMSRFHASDLKMIVMACQQTALSAVKENARGNMDTEALIAAKELVSRIQHKAEASTQEDNLEYLHDAFNMLGTNMSQSDVSEPFPGFSLIGAACTTDTEQYAGGLTEAAPEMFVDLSTGADEDFASIMDLCKNVTTLKDQCDKLRAKTSVSAASIAVHQIMALIEDAVTNRLPLPTSDGKSIYSLGAFDTLASQQFLLADLLAIGKHYVSASFSLHEGDRMLDSNRQIVMSTLMCIMDAAARLPTKGDEFNSSLSRMLTGASSAAVLEAEDVKGMQGESSEVYRPSWTRFSGQSLLELSERMMLLNPAMLQARSTVLNYISASERTGKTVFEFQQEKSSFPYGRQPQFSLKNGDPSLDFMQKLLEMLNLDFTLPEARNRRLAAAHYSGNLNAMSDIERRTRWLCCEVFPACPEFMAYRDMVFLFKLSLEHSHQFFSNNRRYERVGLWYTSHVSPVWSFHQTNHENTIATVRCTIADMDSVNIKLSSGAQGALSPINLQTLVQNARATEEHILHMPRLRSFDESLSQEESEKLLSLLTVPYLCVPLVLQFFCEDRVGLLLNKDLQSLVESVLFEPRAYLPRDDVSAISQVPVPMDQREQLLGTKWGVLCHEVLHGSEAILIPLLSLCRRADDLCVGDFKSTFVSLMLFVVRLAVRIDAFILYAQTNNAWKKEFNPSTEALAALNDLRRFLSTRTRALLRKWLRQSSRAGDVKISTTLHAHLALMQANRTSTLSSEDATALLCSVAFTISWHSSGSDKKESTSDRSRGARSKADQALLFLRPPSSVPIHDVFGVYERQREDMLEWVNKVDSSALDMVLGNIVKVALQREALPDDSEVRRGINSENVTGYRGWSSMDKKPFLCEMTMESSHPYSPSTDYYELVRFPGAQYVSVYFDPLTATEEDEDYITLYKDESCTEFWGSEKKLSGAPSRGYPGASGRPPLVLPADSVYFHFHSDNKTEDWGYKVTFTAPVNMDFAKQLQKEERDPKGTEYTLDVCANALAAAMNRIDDARSLLERERLAAEETVSLEAKIDDEKPVVKGLFRDAMGTIQVNLQTCEVYLRNRMLMPVPAEIAHNEDFRTVFGRRGLFCAIASNNMHRRLIDVLHKDRVYEVSVWRPFRFDGMISIEDDAKGEKENGNDISDDVIRGNSNLFGGLTDQECFNMPRQLRGDRLLFDGVVFSIYEEGMCGWASDLFDPFLKEFNEEASVEMKPLVYAAEGGTRILFYVPPQGELEEVAGHTGGFFEAQLLSEDQPIMNVYALVEEGRLMQRSLVCTTDTRFAYRDLTPLTDKRKKPWLSNCLYQGGNMFDGVLSPDGKLLAKPGAGTRKNDNVGSVVIKRTLLNGEEGMEQFVPSRLLYGIVPEALLKRYRFWLNSNKRTLTGYTLRKDDDTRIIVDLRDDLRSATIRRVHQTSKGNSELSRPMVLLNLLNNKHTSLLRKISYALCNVDNLSNVLAWSSTNQTNVTDECEITLIELPRLLTRFELRTDSKGQNAKFFSMDYDGLFISPRYNDQTGHMSGIPHGLVLEDMNRNLHIMVPNYGASRVQVASLPFATDLILDRTKGGWSKHVSSRFFVYPVHMSGAFMSTPTLGSALYLAFLKLMARNYEICARILDTCKSDSKFSEEERWVMKLMASTAEDCHPDAHACRLRLMLIAEECEEKVDWDVGKDKDGYYKKLNHVSTACRLTKDEESRIGASPNRKQYLMALDQEMDQTITFAGPDITPGGIAPFSLYKLIPGYIQQHQSAAPILRYSRPSETMDPIDLLEELWDDDMMGIKNQRGFAFLYELITGVVDVRFWRKEGEEDAKAVEEEKQVPDVPLETDYNCPACTMPNKLTVTSCGMCGTANPFGGGP